MPSCDYNNIDCDGCNSCRTDEEKQRLRDELMNNDNVKEKWITIPKDNSSLDTEDEDCDEVMNNDDEIFFEFKLQIPKAETVNKIKNICSEIENKKKELNDLIKEYKKLLKKL